MKHSARLALCWLAIGAAAPALADELTVTVNKVTQDGTSDQLGTITITVTGAGANFKADLHGLTPGSHGFHVHQNDSCGPTLLGGIRIPGGAAGGHWDPDFTDKHAGPGGDGHLGDLPMLDAGPDGTVHQTVVAPRIRDLEALKKHSLEIQMGGDSFSDTPIRDGGGGGHFACGVIE